MSSAKTDKPPNTSVEPKILFHEKAAIRKALTDINNWPELEELDWEGIAKDSEKSTQFRIEGNEVYAQKIHNAYLHLKVLKLYTKSIAFAPIGSEELALGYGNRSALLFHVSKFEDCIQDIDRALTIPNENASSEVLKIKLLCRKVECLAGLRSPEASRVFEEVEARLKKADLEDDTKRKFLHKLIDVLAVLENMNLTEEEEKRKIKILPLPAFECSKSVPCASTAVSLVYDNTYGRHIVATRDIRAGEIVVVEKAYQTIVYPQDMYTHCIHCSLPTWASIPCEYCYQTVYCSEECKIEAWENYHEIECPVLNWLNIDRSEDSVEEASEFCLRVFVQAVKKSGGIDKLRQEIEEVEKCQFTDVLKMGFTNGVFRSDSYRSLYGTIYSFKQNIANPLSDFIEMLADLEELAMQPAFLVYFLAKFTTLFGDKYHDDELLPLHDDIVFVGALLLRHIYAFGRIVMKYQKEYHAYVNGGGESYHQTRRHLLPFCSLFSHSCDPNIDSFMTEGCKIVVYARYPIKKGAQLFDNYGFSYLNMVKSDRALGLAMQYGFDCTCVPCKVDWPLEDNLRSLKMPIFPYDSREVRIETEKILDKYDHCFDSSLNNDEQVLQDIPEMMEVLLDHIRLPCLEVHYLTMRHRRILIATYGMSVRISYLC